MDRETWGKKVGELFQLKLALIEHYADAVGTVVREGPFEGLQVPARGHWGGGDLVAKVFGMYESPLHPFWREAFATRYALFLDVGCADGFYATGFALHNPRTRCFGFDQDVRAQASASEQVRRNGLHNCEIRGRFDEGSVAALRQECGLAPDARVLLKCDIEGAERELFSQGLCAGLAHTDVVVELHDFHDDTAVADLLRGRLSSTHRIELVAEGGRNPNAHVLLRHMPEDMRWLVVSESRWSAMRWLIARAV